MFVPVHALHTSILTTRSTLIFNPWRMRKGYSSHSVCVCVCLSVCYQASSYIPCFQVQNAVS